jgi:flagellar biosynthesis/type III secretory pathway protein FliH
MHAKLAIGLLCAALVAALPAHAQWKWKDASGQVHISDRPPPADVPDASILQRPAAPVLRRAAPATPAASPASGAPAAKPRTDPELESRLKKAEDEIKAKAKAEEERVAASRAENCQRARQQLAALESGMRVARMNDKGEREYLDDAQRAAEVQRARQLIASECR